MKNKVLKTMVIAGNYAELQELVCCCAISIWPGFKERYDIYQTFLALDTVRAKREVENGAELDLVVCFEGFPEEELEELKVWLSSRNPRAIFIEVKLSSCSRLMVGLS